MTYEQIDFFKNSKLINENGEPRVYYVDQSALRQNEGAVCFINSQPFNAAGTAFETDILKTSGKTAVYINMQNPLSCSKKFTVFDMEKLVDFSRKAYDITANSRTFLQLRLGEKSIMGRNLADTLETIAKECVISNKEYMNAVNEWEDNRTGLIREYATEVLGLEEMGLDENGELIFVDNRYKEMTASQVRALFLREQAHDIYCEMMSVLGYDGLIKDDLRKTAIPLYPEQVKAVDNEYPTLGRDVFDKENNKKVREEMENYIAPSPLSEKQANFFKNTMAVDPMGKLVEFYFDRSDFTYDDKMIKVARDDGFPGMTCDTEEYNQFTMGSPIKVYLNTEKLLSTHQRVTRNELVQLSDIMGENLKKSETFNKMIHMGPIRRLFDRDFRSSLPDVLDKIAEECVRDEVAQDTRMFLQERGGPIMDFAVNELGFTRNMNGLLVGEDGQIANMRNVAMIYKQNKIREQFTDIMDGLGYDGIVHGSSITVLRPEQIKSIDDIELEKNINKNERGKGSVSKTDIER